MSLRFGSMLCCLMIAIAGCSSSSTTGPGGGPQEGATIVGKWMPEGAAAKNMPEGSLVEYTSDGKIVLHINVKGKMQSADLGTYKVDGNKLTFTNPKTGKNNTDNVIKSVTNDEMVTVDETNGKEEKFKRVQ